eukprot:SRR837773.24332.p1 GENE.SRR837773.24332~~SRR837773.24332.p1  ORF type:complete len:338 (-),score=65.96 SRR837773.24332:82-1095(-)
MSLFGHARDVPGVRWYGKQGPYNIMVMDLEGASLDELFTRSGRSFSLRTVLLLAEQMLERIEFVHSQGILHRDIKPHNFVVGRGDASDCIKIVDFGLAKRFLDRSGRHITCTERKGITGTVRYASLNVHEGLEPSRRDDLEAIGFVLLHFLRGALPWQGLKGTSRHSKHEKIKRCKQKTSFEDLCKGFPHEFVCYFKHVRSLQFMERPDYRYLRKLMKDAFVKNGFKKDDPFEWSEGKAEESEASTTVELADAPQAGLEQVCGADAAYGGKDESGRRRRRRQERDRRGKERRVRRRSCAGDHDQVGNDDTCVAVRQHSKCRVREKSTGSDKQRRKSH